MPDEQTAIDLYDQEGLIRLSEDGQLYSNQTGGVCCNHPTARGFFEPMVIPEQIKGIFWDKCFADEEGISRANEILQQLAYPFRITGGEEAWLYVKGLGFDGILTYENSD